MRRYEEIAKVHTPVPGVAASISVVVIGLFFPTIFEELKGSRTVIPTGTVLR